MQLLRFRNRRNTVAVAGVALSALHATLSLAIATHFFTSFDGLITAAAWEPSVCSSTDILLANVLSACCAAAMVLLATLAPLWLVKHTRRKALGRGVNAVFVVIGAYSLAKVIGCPDSGDDLWGSAVLNFIAAAMHAQVVHYAIARIFDWAALLAAAKLGVPLQSAAGDSSVDAEAEAEARRKAKERASMRRLLALSAPDWRYILFGFVNLAIAAGATTVIPGLIGQIVDGISSPDGGGMTPAVRRTMLELLGASIAAAVFAGLRGYAFTLALARLKVRLRDRLFRSLLTQDIAFFDTTSSGALLSRLSSDTTAVGDQVSLNVNVFLRSLLTAIGSLFFMFSLSPRLTALALCVIPPILWASKSYGHFVHATAKAAQKRLALCNHIAEESLTAMGTVRSFSGESAEGDEHSNVCADYYALNAVQANAYAFYAIFTTGLPSLVTVLILFVGAQLVQTSSKNAITAGVLVGLLLYQQQVTSAFGSLADIYTGLMSAVGSADKIFELLDRVPAVKQNGAYRPSAAESGETGSGSSSSGDVAAAATVAAGGRSVAYRPAVGGGAPAPTSTSISIPVIAPIQSPSQPRSAGGTTTHVGVINMLLQNGERHAVDAAATLSHAIAKVRKSGAATAAATTAGHRSTGATMHAHPASPSPMEPLQGDDSLESDTNSRATLPHLHQEQLRSDPQQNQQLVSFGGTLEMRDVSFSYPTRPEARVLNNFNLRLCPGEVVALVGSSGGGKSSIVKLLQRLYEPDAGVVTLDGVPLSEYDSEWLRMCVGYVGQEPTLFARSLYENILYGLQFRSEEETGGPRALMSFGAASPLSVALEYTQIRSGSAGGGEGGAAAHARCGKTAPAADRRGCFHRLAAVLGLVASDTRKRARGDSDGDGDESSGASSRAAYSPLLPGPGEADEGDATIAHNSTTSVVTVGGPRPVIGGGERPGLRWHTSPSLVDNSDVIIRMAAVRRSLAAQYAESRKAALNELRHERRLRIAAATLAEREQGASGSIDGGRTRLRNPKIEKAVSAALAALSPDSNFNLGVRNSEKSPLLASVFRRINAAAAAATAVTTAAAASGVGVGASAPHVQAATAAAATTTAPATAAPDVSSKLDAVRRNMRRIRRERAIRERIRSDRTAAASAPAARRRSPSEDPNFILGGGAQDDADDTGRLVELWAGSAAARARRKREAQLRRSQQLGARTQDKGEFVAHSVAALNSSNGRPYAATAAAAHEHTRLAVQQHPQSHTHINGNDNGIDSHDATNNNNNDSIDGDDDGSSSSSYLSSDDNGGGGGGAGDDSDDSDTNAAVGAFHIPPLTPTPEVMRHVIACASRANALEFISALPDGFDTKLGEKGMSLSGGQKQRVAIARALARHPRILLLDEATSALDTASERIVQAALEKSMEGRTVLVIAHRLSTVRAASRICVVSGGRIVEEGTHDALLARPGSAYGELVRHQLAPPAAATGAASGGAPANGTPSVGVSGAH